MVDGKNKFSVLFTGGLDSAYRLCQLALDENAIVQPVYILFPNDGNSSHVRPEMKREIEAQDKILDYIVKHPNTKAKFLPIHRIHRDSIPNGLTDFTLSGVNVFNWLVQLGRSKLGWQYYYIALYARWDVGIELCQEIFPPAFKKANIQFYEDELGRKRIKLDSSIRKGLGYFKFIFGNLSYPILGVSRQQMKDDLDNWGYAEIWNYIWFCYKAVNGKPCGFCDNCFFKIQQGLSFLFDKEAIHRYYIRTVLDIFSDKKIRSFFEEYGMYGEDILLNAIFRERLHNEWGLKSFFDLNPFLFKKLYEMNNKSLEKIAKKYNNENDLCKMFLLKSS